ncbi:MAG TPA: putative glycoside hydrolase, partial [Candidatus Paceibacterota bacterium]|nr:putative glycoside hydrolase [Candidatus Paceibacterota bacterium]
MHYAKRFKHQLAIFGGIIFLALVTLIALPHVGASTYTRTTAEPDTILPVVEKPKKPVVEHLKTPEKVKAIYMSQCVVGTPSFRERLVELIDTTELNAVVIDIKDFSGKLAFTTNNPLLSDSVSGDCGATDIEAFIKTLHEKDIYVIGRVTVFQDPYYSKLHPELAVKKASDGTVWEDFKGLSFIDVGAKEYWKHVVEIAKESYRKGFDEINLDYVRYPSDGNMKDIAFMLGGQTKAETLEAFFAYFYDELSEPFDDFEDVPALSVDLFGYTTTNTDDLGIGQVLERALPYFDY